MATRLKAVIESRNGEKFSPITITKNVLTDDGQNLHDILSDRKEDMMTPTIENSSSMFKVGQGDNVDYSSNVVNGAYESMVLKGKTMVNCIQEPSSQDVVLPYAFEEGQYVTINDTKESGALGVELKGQTLVNLFNTEDIVGGNDEMTIEKGVITLPIKNHRYNNFNIPKSKCTMFKPSTKYTMWVNMLENRSEDSEGETQQSGSFWLQTYDYSNSIVKTSNQGTYGCRFENNEVGVKTCVFETHAQNEYDSKNGGLNFDLPCYYAKNGGIQRVSIVIMEGDWTGQELPFDKFFTGMTSCKMPILHTVGKNLLKYSMDNVYTNSSHSRYAPVLNEDGSITVNSCYDEPYWLRKGFYVEKGKEYTVTVKGMKSGDYSALCFGFDNLKYLDGGTGKALIPANTNGNCIDTIDTYGTKKMTCTALETGYITRFYIHGSGLSSRYTILEFQVEEGSSATPYEPHKTSILSLPEEVVLRSLPNGVCDTFNTRTGVYTQRVGAMVLNGSDPITSRMTRVDNILTTTSRCYLDYASIPSDISMKPFSSANEVSNKLICDTLPVKAVIPNIQQDDIESVGQTTAGFSIRVKGKTIAECKQRLVEQPITIQYELATPIVTKINLSSTLKSWNTTTHIYSEIPENSLYPTLSHSSPTYPVILKPSTKYSIVANSYGNNHTNSAINFNLGGATASTTVGNRVTTITTPSTLSNELLIMSGQGNTLSHVMVIEGDVVGDEPYFEGICDCKSPILSNVGKNLFDGEIEAGRWLTYGNLGKYNAATGFRSANIITITPSSRYTISGNFKASGYFVFGNKDGYVTRYIGLPRNSQSISFNTNLDECYGVWYTVDIEQTEANKPTNIQLEETSAATPYEPYKSNTVTFDQKDGKTIVLRSLPNGVCDTLNVETGEYVQRIGEVVLDGSDVSYISLSEENNYRTSTSCSVLTAKNSAYKITNSFYCDSLPTYSHNLALWNVNNKEYGISRVSAEWGFCMRLPHTLTGVTMSDDGSIIKQKFKEYLHSNPVIVQCELTTPIVSTIDVQGFPYAYTSGHMQLTSDSIEQSLTPKVEYSVATNRNGQVRSNQKMVERHQKQLDRLQAMILTNLVNTQYEQTLTNLKYDLKNVREEVK